MLDKSGSPFRISVCPTGCVHLHFGCTSVHMSKEEFVLLSDEIRRTVNEMTPPKDNLRLLDQYRISQFVRLE